MIPPEQNSIFVANMEMVLDVYKRPFDPRNPVMCMDESPKQLIGETRTPVPCSSGKPARYDYEYKRYGMCNIFLAYEPVNGGLIFPNLVGLNFPTFRYKFYSIYHKLTQNY